MPVFRFRVHWEEDDQIYRDIEITNGDTSDVYKGTELFYTAFDYGTE